MPTTEAGEIIIPKNYVCEECGAKDCKLWREYSTFAIQLLCANCVEQETGKTFALDGSGRDKLESMAWWVAAVPTPEGDSYWGYTSVPQDRVEWWHALPTRPA